MNKLDFKIAYRNFTSKKFYNFLNLISLSVGLASFILVMLYVNSEIDYDKWNGNRERIFLVGLQTPNGPSAFTPSKLAQDIIDKCPDVQEVGRTNTAMFQIPFYSKNGKVIIKNWVGADYSIAKIFDIKPKGLELVNQGEVPSILLSEETGKILFPKENEIQNNVVTMMSKSGPPLPIMGIVAPVRGKSNLIFDCIGFSNDITSGKNTSYAANEYRTYILVKKNTDIEAILNKIDKIYKENALSDSSVVAKTFLTKHKGPVVFLDKLKDLNLKPTYGSDINYRIVTGLTILSIIILIISGINFTSLYVSQANTRSKEVGIKKTAGISKNKIACQFVFEIFLQCIIALVFAVAIAIVALPYMHHLFEVSFTLSDISIKEVGQVLLAVLLLTLISGIYPALLMAKFKPIVVLRGDLLATGSGKLSWLRKGIVLFQLGFAILFVISLIFINKQINFMKAENSGFKPENVLYVDNIAFFNNPKDFASARRQIKQINGVDYVTVASNIPGGNRPASKEFNFKGEIHSLNAIGVDYEYFETLGIPLNQGRLFDPSYPDSANVIINELAANKFGRNPIGQTISGCGIVYKIIGVVRNIKAYGFEEKINPTIYLLNDNCNLSKLHILIRYKSYQLSSITKTLSNQWSVINKLDGDNFSYHFVDDLYKQLFIKQNQLQAVLIFFSTLAIIIAALGVFSLSANYINIRTKEIAIRKVFGATTKDILILLSKPFIYLAVIANMIIMPFTIIIVNNWLNSFSYRISLNIFPFILTLLISISIIFITITLQVLNTARFMPGTKLKK